MTTQAFISRVHSMLLGCALAGVPALVTASPPDQSTAAGGSSGADVIVSSLSGINKYGSVAGITGYSLGTTACNIGDEWVEWFELENRHPLIAQNLYRINNGRFEQIGASWVKHGWCAADFSTFHCAASGGPPQCDFAQGCDWLGNGCIDVYGPTLNGTQEDLGPRSEANPWTGEYPYPYVLQWSQTGNAIFKRMQVRISDLDPTKTPGAVFIGEGHYICTNEPPANRYNNASWCRVARSVSFDDGYPLSFTGSPAPQQAAIEAWPAFDPTVVVVDGFVPGEGRFILGYKTIDLGDGAWSYEYALYNMNSDRAAGRFSVPVPGVGYSSVGFRDIEAHSGEPYSSADWSVSNEQGGLTWQTESYTSDPNANALRWGTLYNFRFIANRPPAPASVQIGLFKPGHPAFLSLNAVAPQPVATPGDMNCDGIVTPGDIAGFVLALTNPPQYAADYPFCLAENGDINGDGVVTPGDIAGFVVLLTR